MLAIRPPPSSISAMLVTSARRWRTSPASSATVAFSRSPSKSASTSRAPSRQAAPAMARPMPDAAPVTTMTWSRRFRKSATGSAGSKAAAPEGAVASQDEWQVLLVSGPALILRQLQFLLDRIPALARLGLDLHRGGGVLQEHQLILHVLFGAEPPSGRARMTGNQLVPVHRQHLLYRVFCLEGIKVEHAAPGHRTDREEVHREQHLLFQQPHDERAVRMVEADVAQLERRVTEGDRSTGVYDLVRQDRMRVLESDEPLAGAPVSDDRHSGVLEGLAAGDVVEVVVAIDQILDRLARDLLDLID